MEIYTGKVMISELVNAMSEEPDFEEYYVHKPSGKIGSFSIGIIDLSLKNVNENNPDLSLPISFITKREPLIAEFLQKPDGFCKIPNVYDVGLTEPMKQFISENPAVGMKFDENIKKEKFFSLFDKYVTKYELVEKWAKIEADFLINYAINWCKRNSLDYINDCADDYAETLENVSYVFSVSLGKGCYRHIKISSRCVLYDLHTIILDAFNFYDDHAHAFFMNNRAWNPDFEYTSPGIDESNKYTTNAYLAEFHFEKGDKFLYIFDFGDEWRFSIKFLRKIDEPCDDPEIIKSVGEAPEQYSDYF